MEAKVWWLNLEFPMGQPFLQWCLALGQPIDIVGEAGLATVDLEEGTRKKLDLRWAKVT